MISTHSTKPADIQRNWYVVDASGVILGRLSAEIAKILRGKNKPYFTPNLDCGDYVVVINADKVKLTGKKLTDKHYYQHTGYIGSVKDTTAGKILNSRFPERVIQKAVERMISRGITGLGICTTFGARVERMMPSSWFTSCCYSSPSSHFSTSNTRAGS